jgi:hypothetical protein
MGKIYIYIYIYICVYVYIYILIHILKYVSIIYLNSFSRLNSVLCCTYTCTYTSIYSYTYTYIYDVSIIGFQGLTAFFAACIFGHLEVARLLLKNGANINHTNKQGMYLNIWILFTYLQACTYVYVYIYAYIHVYEYIYILFTYA